MPATVASRRSKSSNLTTLHFSASPPVTVPSHCGVVVKSVTKSINRRRSPIPVLTRLNVEQLCLHDERRYHSAKSPTIVMRLAQTAICVYVYLLLLALFLFTYRDISRLESTLLQQLSAANVQRTASVIHSRHFKVNTMSLAKYYTAFSKYLSEMSE